jgi:hypothetical protein
VTARVINDPSALGWEYDPDTGRWTWGGGSSSGGGGGNGDVDLSNVVKKNVINDIEEGKFSIVWDDSADPDFPFNGRIGYNGNNKDPDSVGGSFLYAKGIRGTVSIGRDGDMELHGQSEIKGVPDREGNLPWITDFDYVQAADFLDADGNSIIGQGGGGIPDAPATGNIYGRKNNDWVIVPTSGGDGGSVDLSAYYTKTESDARYQLKGNYLTSESDPTVPQHVKSISQADINKWNSGGGDVDLTGYATQTWVSTNYQPKGSYLTSESDPTVPAHVKSISQSDINKWNNPPSGGNDYDGSDAVKLTGDQTIGGTKTFSGGVTYFQNLFISGVSAGGVGLAGNARIEFTSGATTVYSGTNTLQVNSGGTSISGSLIATGVVQGTDCIATSDERLKKDVQPCKVGVVTQLDGVDFVWKQSEGKASGVIAQRVSEIPELEHLVHYNDNDGHYGVSYLGLIPYLLEEIKSLQGRVEELENG